MADSRWSDPSAPAGDLPDEIYIAFVDGLVSGAFVPLALSTAAVMGGEIAAGLAAGQPILAYAATSQLLIAAVRFYFVKRHAKSLPSSTVEIARRQERNFSRGALASLAGLSLWRSGSPPTASPNSSA